MRKLLWNFPPKEVKKTEWIEETLEAIVDGFTVIGAKEVVIEKVSKSCVEVRADCIIDKEFVKTWLNLRKGEGHRNPLNSTELGKKLLALTLGGVKIEVMSGDFKVRFDDEGAEVSPNEGEGTVFRFDSVRWLHLNSFKKDVMRAPVKLVIVHDGEEEQVQPEQPKGGLLYECEHVKIYGDSFRPPQSYRVFVNGICVHEDYYSSNKAEIHVFGREEQAEIEGVRVKLPTIFDKNVEELKNLAVAILARMFVTERFPLPLSQHIHELSSNEVRMAGEVASAIRKAVEETPAVKIIVDSFLPDYDEVVKKANLLLTEVNCYGYAREKGMEKVPAVNALKFRNLYFAKKRPSGDQSKKLAEQGITVIYTDSSPLVEYLKKLGVQEATLPKTDYLTVYVSEPGKLSKKPKYLDLDDIVRMAINGAPIVCTEKISDVDGTFLPDRTVIVKGNSKQIAALKTILGGAATSPKEFRRKVREMTIVTDGKNVYTLNEVKDEYTLLLHDNRTEILPYLNLFERVYSVLCSPPGVVPGMNMDEFVKKHSYILYRASEKLGCEAADLLKIILENDIRPICNPSYKKLVDLLEELSGIEKGLPEEELLDDPKVHEIMEREVIVRLGYLKPEYTGLKEGVSGLPIISRLAPYKYVQRPGNKLKDLVNLTLTLGLKGSAIFTGRHDLVEGIEEIANRELRGLIAKYAKDAKLAKLLAMSLL